MRKSLVWVAITLIFSVCLAFFAGAALLDVFVIEHKSNEDIIVESIDFGVNFGTSSLESDLNATDSKSTSKATTSTSNKNNNANKETEKQNSSSSTNDNSSSIPQENIGNVLSEAELATLAKAITLTKTVGTYSNDNVDISVEEKIFTSGSDKTVYFVVDIKVSSVEYFKTALASGSTFTTNKTETVANLAKANNAILAINGDGCGQSNRNRGYLVRNGVTYRSTAKTSGDTEALVIYGDGTMGIIDEKTTALSAVTNKWQVFSFGPALINNGKISVTQRQEISGQSMADNPRTAIGMVEPLHYVIIVGNGRTSNSKGLTLYQLAQALAYEGCTVGYNLDGGGSTTLWFNGKVINYPTTNGSYKERGVSDIVYIGA